MEDHKQKSAKDALQAVESIHKGKFGDAIILLNCAIRERKHDD